MEISDPEVVHVLGMSWQVSLVLVGGWGRNGDWLSET
jgi:hypothetical protein